MYYIQKKETISSNKEVVIYTCTFHSSKIKIIFAPAHPPPPKKNSTINLSCQQQQPNNIIPTNHQALFIHPSLKCLMGHPLIAILFDQRNYMYNSFHRHSASLTMECPILYKSQTGIINNQMIRSHKRLHVSRMFSHIS